MATFERRVQQYVALRDMIDKEDKEHEEKMKQKREWLKQLNIVMLQMLQQSGQDSAKTAAGTVYRKINRSATIADASAFKRHVIGQQAFDLIDWRANKTAIADFIEQHNEPPPGINYTTTVDVGVRRATRSTLGDDANGK